MRDLKFRAWNIIVKRFHFFELPDIEKQKGKIQWDILKIDQYTGLTDKNGVEIYEGDIVLYDTGDKAKIIFKEGQFMGYDGYANDSDEAYLKISPELDYEGQPEFTIEVIGNIHENPELL